MARCILPENVDPRCRRYDRQRRLGEVQRPRRAREVALLRHRPGVTQQPQIEVHAGRLTNP
jgi:hypothetical protein